MKKMLVCNQKMFLTHDEAIILEDEMRNVDLTSVNLIVCPSYLNLDVFKNYNLGAQDAFYEDKGAFTGKVSAYDLSLVGVKYVIVGHSEIRGNDTDDIINKKVKAILRNSMTPILCVGETKIDRELRRTSEVIKRQLKLGLKDVILENSQEVVIAYEPCWAIGSGKHPDETSLEDAVLYIKNILKQINISNYKIIYGGSIGKYTTELLSNKLVDGYLIGSSSVVLDEFKMIIKCIK